MNEKLPIFTTMDGFILQEYFKTGILYCKIYLLANIFVRHLQAVGSILG